MTNTTFIPVPFALEGDLSPIPTDRQSDGSISLTEGFGPDYAKDLATVQSAKAIERSDMNSLFYLLFAVAKQYQEEGIPEWFNPSNTGYNYRSGTTVRYTDSSGKQVYRTSLKDNNSDEPSSSSWGPLVFRTATNAEVTAKRGNYPVTPQQAVKLALSQFNLPDGTLTQKGIVQLSNELDSDNSSKAATPSAVQAKLTHQLQDLGTTNLDTLKAFSNRGVYWQGTQANATTANGYPEDNLVGVLLCIGRVGEGVQQIYIDIKGKTWVRTANPDVAGSPWRAWASAVPVIPTGSTSRAGIVQLSNDTKSNSQKVAATSLAVYNKMDYRRANLGSTDLDTLSDADDFQIAFQNSKSNATAESNYPEESAGTLFCTNSINKSPQQTYITTSGNIYTRNKASDGTWVKWKNCTPKFADASTKTAGVVQLSDELDGTSSKLAATEKAVGQKITYRGSLGETNLNKIISADQRGIWVQTSNANATAARNYPVTKAGELYALGWISSNLSQLYIPYDGSGVYKRYANSSDEWQDWVNVANDQPAGSLLIMALSGSGKVPDGYLVCNGGLLKRDDYKKLFGVIGKRYNNPGDDATKFRLPKFTPGMALLANNGDENFDITQNGAVIKHTHKASSNTIPNHQHISALGENQRSVPDPLWGYAPGYDDNKQWGTKGSDPDNSLPFTSPAGSFRPTITVTAAGGAQNKAWGLSMLFCIKY